MSKVESLNCGRFQIYSSIVLAIAICSLGACPCSRAQGYHAAGYQAIDARHSFYWGTVDNQGIWGIIMPTWEVPEMWFGKTNAAAIYHQSGIGIKLSNNAMTITNSTKTVTFEIEPGTIYLIDTNLDLQETKDLSDVELVPVREQSGGHFGELPAGTWINGSALHLPDDLLDRFKPQK